MLKNILIELRPKQWVKNFFVFLALVFSRKFFSVDSIYLTFGAFLGFVFASSFVYVINDIIDINKDKHHPIKSKRPIASGKISIKFGIVISIFLLILSILIPHIFNYFFNGNNYIIIAILTYIFLTTCYSIYLKNIVIVDVLIIAIGFVIRAIGGAISISVPISSWFVITVLLISLFLALVKRRQEIVLNNKESQREVLKYYTKELLDQFIVIASSGTIITYALYSMEKREAVLMPFTTIFVIYGIFRYLYIIKKEGIGEFPEKILFTDKPFIINILLSIIFIILIIIFNPKVFK